MFWLCCVTLSPGGGGVWQYLENKGVIFGPISICCRVSVRHFEEYHIRYFMGTAIYKLKKKTNSAKTFVAHLRFYLRISL